MAIRITIDIPERLHDRLRARAARSGVSIYSLMLQAIEQAYGEPGKGARLKGPLVTGRGKLGPAFPKDENPHDLVSS
jgi:hypothetical protein